MCNYVHFICELLYYLEYRKLYIKNAHFYTITKEQEIFYNMADEYIKQMIDLLNEKIRNLELKKEEQRKEINRLKRYIAELKKEIRE